MVRGNAWRMTVVIVSICISGFWIGARAQGFGDTSIPPRGGHGRIKIITKPEKVLAYLGGVNLGLTPIDTEFESGRHSLTLMLEGEELVRQRINIWPDSTTTIRRSLRMPYGTLVIKPDPVGINYQIFVDSQIVGDVNNTGVTTLNRIDAGTRTIGIFSGKRSKEYQVVVPAEQTVELNVELKDH